MREGTQIGPYLISCRLGAGGMGEVFRARDTRLNRDVAVKVLPREFAADTDRLRRFEQESRTLAALNHPNVLTIHDAGVHEGEPYLVSELLEGRTLREELASGTLPGRKLIAYAQQIAFGLAAAHEKEIIHRDLKPDNIFVSRDGRVKILDFGLAKLRATSPQGQGLPPAVSSDAPTLAQADLNEATEPGRVMGTANYMAPEQVRGEPVDRRTDLFAFGCVLYEMASRERPFKRNTTVETMAAIVGDEPRELAAINPDVPPALARIVHRCLEKDAGRRFQSAHDLAFALESLSGSETSIGAKASNGKPHSRLSRWMPIGFTALLGVAGLVLWDRVRPANYAGPTTAAHVSIALPPGANFLSQNRPLIAISPDGSRVVYAARGTNGIPQLWEQRLDDPVPRPIRGTEGAEIPFFSPDGLSVGYHLDEHEAMMKVSLAGGAPVVITDKMSGNHGASWGLDGNIYFAPGWSEGIWRVSAEVNAQPSLVIDVDPSKNERGTIWPTALPDGDTLLYTVWTGDTFDSAKVVAYSLKTKQRKDLFKGAQTAAFAANPSKIIFAREGALYELPFDLGRLERKGAERLLVPGVLMGPIEGDAQFSVSAAGSIAYIPGSSMARPVKAVWIDRQNKCRSVMDSLQLAGVVRLSPDGTTLAVGAGAASKVDIYTLELARGIASKLSTSGDDYGPIWTPDGSKLIFISGRLGGQTLFWRNSDGTGPEEALTSNDGRKQATTVSPDGQTLLIEWHRGGAWGIWSLPLNDREHKPVPLLTNSWNHSDAVFSPDGKWIAYSSDESGRQEVYIQSYPEMQRKARVSPEGGRRSVWSRDGKTLFYQSGRKLMAVESLNKDRFQPGKPETVFEASGWELFDISLDGTEFLVSMPDESAAITRFNWFDYGAVVNRQPPSASVSR